MPNDIIIRDGDIAGAVTALYELDKARTWRLSIAQYRKRRTDPQNRIFHFWCKILADHFGDAPVSVKEDLKQMFCPYIDGMEGHRSKLTGRVTYRTSEMDTRQMGQFMDFVSRWAWNSHRVQLPNKDDMIFAEIEVR